MAPSITRMRSRSVEVSVSVASGRDVSGTGFLSIVQSIQPRNAVRNVDGNTEC